MLSEKLYARCSLDGSRLTRIFLILLSGAGIGFFWNEAVVQNRVAYCRFHEDHVRQMPLARSIRTGKPTVDASQNLEHSGRTILAVLFYSSSCKDCRILTESILPLLSKRYGASLHVQIWDIDQEQNFRKMLEYESRFGSREDVPAKIFLRDRYLAGTKAIQETIFEAVDDEFRRK